MSQCTSLGSNAPCKGRRFVKETRTFVARSVRAAIVDNDKLPPGCGLLEAAKGFEDTLENPGAIPGRQQYGKHLRRGLLLEPKIQHCQPLRVTDIADRESCLADAVNCCAPEVFAHAGLAGSHWRQANR
jgi:hypothetical protein